MSLARPASKIITGVSQGLEIFENSRFGLRSGRSKSLETTRGWGTSLFRFMLPHLVLST